MGRQRVSLVFVLVALLGVASIGLFWQNAVLHREVSILNQENGKYKKLAAECSDENRKADLELRGIREFLGGVK